VDSGITHPSPGRKTGLTSGESGGACPSFSPGHNRTRVCRFVPVRAAAARQCPAVPGDARLLRPRPQTARPGLKRPGANRRNRLLVFWLPISERDLRVFSVQIVGFAIRDWALGKAGLAPQRKRRCLSQLFPGSQVSSPRSLVPVCYLYSVVNERGFVNSLMREFVDA